MVSHSSSLFTDAWSATEDLIPRALTILKETQLVHHEHGIEIPWRLLIKKNDGLRVLVIFDICNTEYDPAKAHLPGRNNLPVLVVHFSRKGVHTRVAESGLRQRVNNETAEAHNLHGWDALPPYVTDHTTTIPIYMNPRDISQPKAISSEG